jgi:hypothetical protein
VTTPAIGKNFSNLKKFYMRLHSYRINIDKKSFKFLFCVI